MIGVVFAKIISEQWLMINAVSGLLKYETNYCKGLFGMLNKNPLTKKQGILLIILPAYFFFGESVCFCGATGCVVTGTGFSAGGITGFLNCCSND